MYLSKCSIHPNSQPLKAQCYNCGRDPLCETCIRTSKEGGAVYYYCSDCKPNGDIPSANVLARLKPSAGWRE